MTDKIETDNVSLRDIADGFVKFTIKARDTEENKLIHDAFKEFCKQEMDDNYTQGLKKLIEYYQSDFKYELIADKIDSQYVVLEELRGSIIDLQKKGEEPKKEKDGVF